MHTAGCCSRKRPVAAATYRRSVEGSRVKILLYTSRIGGRISRRSPWSATSVRNACARRWRPTFGSWAGRRPETRRASHGDAAGERRSRLHRHRRQPSLHSVGTTGTRGSNQDYDTFLGAQSNSRRNGAFESRFGKNCGRNADSSTASTVRSIPTAIAAISRRIERFTAAG